MSLMLGLEEPWALALLSVLGWEAWSMYAWRVAGMLGEGGWWGCWQGGRQAREEGREGGNDMGGNVMKNN